MSLWLEKALSSETKLTTKGEISGGDKGDFCPIPFASRADSRLRLYVFEIKLSQIWARDGQHGIENCSSVGRPQANSADNESELE
jgi:hypothetical protein